MKIINRTNWNTKQFGAFIRRIAEREHISSAEMKRLRVSIVYRKRSSRWDDSHASGMASLTNWTMTLYVVKGVQVDKVELAHTIAHELAHCQGVKHGAALRTPRYGWAVGWREVWAWTDHLPLTMNADKAKKIGKVDRATLKLEHCQKQLTVWERKLRFAQTKIRVWKQKARYHEGRLAALKPAHDLAVKQAKEIMDTMKGNKNEC